jgi:stress-induced morphogen
MSEGSNIAQKVEEELQKSFAPTEFVSCIDESDGCGDKLQVTVVYDQFEKVMLIKRHRKVQKVLDDAGFGMDRIHAITINAWTCEQWKKKQQV